MIAVPEPDAAANELESALGIACTSGGRHDGAGTFNRITWLTDGAYLKLIGVDDRAAAADNPIGAAALGILRFIPAENRARRGVIHNCSGNRYSRSPSEIGGGRGYIRKTPKRVSGMGAFSAALMPIASTRRVSSGSITPSSQSRAVEW